MKDITSPHSYNSISASDPSKLPMHRDSHLISKFKPRVRIIHIFAPEIIKTDVANFRELVQRLTGKPGQDERSKNSSGRNNNKKKTKNSAGCTKLMMKKTTPFSRESVSKKAMQLQNGFPSLKILEENEIWGSNGGENSNGFLDGFADLNGFIHDLSDKFCLATPQFADIQLA